MGMSACWQLGRRGQRVLGLDRFAVPHSMGSHHGHSRMIRLSYFEHPDYVPLLRRTYQLWHELERGSEWSILQATGGLYLSPADGVIVPGCLRASMEHGLDHELLDQAAVGERYPQFRLPEGYHGFYERAAGVLLVEPALHALHRLATNLGGDLRGNEPVRAWKADGQSVTVTTEKGVYEAERLIIAGGAWSHELLGQLGVPLSVTRQTMFWLPMLDQEGVRSHPLPAWFVEYQRGHGIYGFPELPGQPGFKVAEHVNGEAVTPEGVNRECSDADWHQVQGKVNRFLPALAGQPLSNSVCLYTNSPDGNFVIDQHPHWKNVTLGTGFSGHGFKFAPVIGEALAQLALDGHTPLPIDFLSLSRFSMHPEN